MKKIFDGEVFDILPLKTGIIFSYCNSKEEDNLYVFFKMLSFETGRLTDITKNIYLITKYGNSYNQIVANCENYVTEKSIVLPNGKVFLLSKSGKAGLYDVDGTAVWTGTLSYRDGAPSDIALFDNALWITYSGANAILKYSIATMKEELRLGGNDSSPFIKPRNIFLADDVALISGDNKIVALGLKDFSLREYEHFDEQVYQFVEVAGNRFALLESGLYLI